MSYFGALGTAVQGITAQAAAIGHISDNVANATTVGYKQVGTDFHDLVHNKVLGDSAVLDSNRNMGVSASAAFAHRQQGQIISNNSFTAIAVDGNGFIPVAKATGIDSVTGEPTGFETTTYYTRLGDFRLDDNNRLVNSAGFYLMAAEVGGTTISPLEIDDEAIAAVPTTTVNYRANLPANAANNSTFSNGIAVIDSESEERNFQLLWEKTGTNAWDLTINTTGGTPASFGPINVTFTNGLLGTMTTADTNLTVTAAGAATVSLSPDFGNGAQAITINLGDFNGAFDAAAVSGLTQYGGNISTLTNLNIDQNGLKGGEFTYVTFAEDGGVIYNYENGRSQVGAQLLLANFPEPDRLDRLDGTVFTQTSRSGAAVLGIPGDGTNDAGVGVIRPGALEESTVDVAEQMTRLIVAQQAYSMNGQVISAADSMWSRAIDMKR
ncbi:flagellar hook protein FlgE [Ferrovibrio sp.]|uniref:flagellar hook protein FlgE n=1 Tax=Ferrovibrio sp. TaxID=1917215 RepID=UPI00260BC792|nr:flagellar hook-basal body complex protein [Ferrovibrio sp.]